MAENKVLGRSVIAGLNVSGTYYPIFCGKTAELPIDQDEIEITSVNSGSDREYVPGMSSQTLTVTGVTTLNNTGSRISVLYLMELARRREIHSLRLLFIDTSGSQVAITFLGFIKNTNVSRDVLQWSQSSVTFRITGPITFDTIIPDPVAPACEEEDPLYKTLLSAATSVQDNLLIQALGTTTTILMVSRSGQVHSLTVGTPGSLEFTYNSTTGTIGFDPLNPGNVGGEPVVINYKIE